MTVEKSYGVGNVERNCRHIRALRCLEHPNILHLRDIIIPTSLADERCRWPLLGSPANNILLEIDWYPTNLGRVIRSSTNLTDLHVQYFLYQMLCALKFMHSGGFHHEYMMPEDVLVKADCHLVIADCRNVCRAEDFQAAAGEADIDPDEPSPRGRWYHPPEALASCRPATHRAGIWSLGCILAELLTRRPLFPLEDAQRLLRAHVSAVGKPGPDALRGMGCGQSAIDYIQRLPAPAEGAQRAPLWPQPPPAASDLLARLLRFDPAERPEAAEALRHEVRPGRHRQARMIRSTASRPLSAPAIRLGVPPPLPPSCVEREVTAGGRAWGVNEIGRERDRRGA